LPHGSTSDTGLSPGATCSPNTSTIASVSAAWWVSGRVRTSVPSMSKRRSTGGRRICHSASPAVRFAPIPIIVVALAVAAPPAAASVAIGPQRVVVSGDGGTVTVTRQPFRLEFADAAGRPVLAQVENSGQQPLVVPPSPSPIPLGNDTQTRPTLYAPLTFTVGQARDFQYPGSQWNGNELSGTEAGVQFSARDVVDAQPSGDGVKLTVSTSDPSGRELAVTIAPGPAGAFSVHAEPTPSDGVATLGDSFASQADEAFHGFGGRHNALDQRGQDFYNWIEQENVGAGYFDPAVAPAPGQGGHGYLFPNGATAAYWLQSQFVSSHRYGFLLNRDELSRWRMGSDRPDAWQVSAAAPALDYVVAPGDPPDAIRNLTAATGRHQPPPEWALGPQMDRLVRFPNETPETYDKSVQDDLARLERHEIPLTGYRIEGWWYYDDAALEKIIGRLHALGIHALLYFRSFADTSGNSGVDDADAFGELTQNGWAATTPAGSPYVFGSNFNAPAVLVDFTNPGAVQWWEERMKRGLDLGADGFMQDFGEQTQVDMRFADGSTGAAMHNRYPNLYHRVTHDFVARYEREHRGRQIFWYTRAGYSGLPGSPAYEQSNFPGDETTDWSRSSGLASLTTDMLNRAVGGAYGFNADIGGYLDVGPYPETTKELLIRWAEWEALSPIFRLHGAASAGTHAPWTFDADTVRLYNQISDLRITVAPLVGQLWREAARTGIPVTRPLWLEFPGDAEAAKQDQEWMLGPDVLVAPVVEEGKTARDVYFPAGCWRAPDNGETHRGPAHAEVSAPLARLPYFFRCGSQPLGPAAQAPRGCVDRRKLSFRIHQPRRGRIVRVVAYVNGRRTRAVSGRRVTRFTLRRLPKGRFTVRIVAVSSSGQRTVSVRRYRGCRKGRPRTRVHR
jgi:sulfoquinovosidase